MTRDSCGSSMGSLDRLVNVVAVEVQRGMGFRKVSVIEIKEMLRGWLEGEPRDRCPRSTR